MGVLLLDPVFAVLGLATGVVVGGMSGAMSHVGMDEDFMEDLANHLKPGSSALCVLVREDMEKVLAEIKPFGGRIFHTPLLHTDEKKLTAALEEIKASAGQSLNLIKVRKWRFGSEVFWIPEKAGIQGMFTFSKGNMLSLTGINRLPVRS